MSKPIYKLFDTLLKKVMRDEIIPSDLLRFYRDLSCKYKEGDTSALISILVNGILEGTILDDTIEIILTDGVNPVVPNSVIITSRTVAIEVPSGGGSYDLDLVDRFGNAFPTKQVSANATWDLRTLTPFDWADMFITLINAGLTTPQENAIIDFVTNQISSGIWQKRYVIYPFIGGTSTRHAINMRYPFDNVPSGQLTFLGSPTHDANGVTITSGSIIISPMTPKNILANNLNVFHYCRTNNQVSGFGADWDATQFNQPRHYASVRNNTSNNCDFGIGNTEITTFTSSNSDGGWHANGASGKNNGRIIRNGNTGSPLQTFTDRGLNNNFRTFTMGGTLSPTNGVQNNALRNYAGWAIGERLTDTQMADDYAQWQALQTAFSRNV